MVMVVSVVLLMLAEAQLVDITLVVVTLVVVVRVVTAVVVLMLLLLVVSGMVVEVVVLLLVWMLLLWQWGALHWIRHRGRTRGFPGAISAQQRHFKAPFSSFQTISIHFSVKWARNS